MKIVTTANYPTLVTLVTVLPTLHASPVLIKLALMILPATEFPPQLHEDVNLIFIQIKENVLVAMAAFMKPISFSSIKGDFFVTQLVHVPSVVPPS